MQILHEQSPIVSIKKLSNVNMSLETSSHYFEVKEKRSSNASLLVMNPVASGDNMATDLNSNQKFKDELPPLVPCCEGKELQISEDLVRSGLSAISVKHEGVIQCLSMSNACEKILPPAGLVKHRNSFRCLHRPDLKRVPYLRRLTPDELETIFRGFADIPQRRTINDNLKAVAPSTKSLEVSVVSKDLANKTTFGQTDGNDLVLHPIPETRSTTDDVPLGMRLHGTRARLYTSVLAGTTTGDHLDALTSEDYDTKVPDDVITEDENEELQIILPPKCDDVPAGSSVADSVKS